MKNEKNDKKAKSKPANGSQKENDNKPKPANGSQKENDKKRKGVEKGGRAAKRPALEFNVDLDLQARMEESEADE